jgi:hypothetical protein
MPPRKAPRLLTFVGALVIILVATAFTVVGWQTLRLECERYQSAATPSCTVQNGYFFGFFKTSPRRIDNVTAVGYRTSTTKQILQSTVVLTGDGGDVPLFETSSNVNDLQKREVRREARGFLNDPARPSLRYDTWFSNIFGWIGLPLFLAIVLSVGYSTARYVLRAIRAIV